MDYEVITRDGEKAVKFTWNDNGKIRERVNFVKRNFDGYEYVCVPNPLNPKQIFSFRGRIKDAVEQIRTGLGDCILQARYGISVFVYDDVIMYLDRKFGDEIKKQSIEGWKDAKFGYSIAGEFKNSLNGPMIFDADGNGLPRLQWRKPCIFFETEEAAKKQIDIWTEQAKKIGETYNRLEQGFPEDENSVRITEDTPYVVSNLSNNFYFKKEDEYCVEIIQTVKEN